MQDIPVHVEVMLPTGVFDTTALQDYNKYRIYQAMSKACKSEVLNEPRLQTKRKKHHF